MENRGIVELPTPLLLRLQDHLRLTASKLSMEQAIIQAVEQWHQQASQSGAAAPGYEGRGYQWKSLFLPESTRLRMIYRGKTYYAEVSGDQLRFEGKQVSPRQMVMAITGNVRNPWLDLYVRFPGERDWLRAKSCKLASDRGQVFDHASPPAVLPDGPLAMVAAAMTDALKTTHSLVEQALMSDRHNRHNMHNPPKNERRLPKNRRDSDVFHDHCSFD